MRITTSCRAAACVAAAGVSLLLATGCSRDTPQDPSGAPPATTTASTSHATTTSTSTPSPTPAPTDPAIVFAADGIGPYVIGTPLTDLESKAQLANLEESPFCDAKVAQGTGAYAGKLSVTFRNGRLTAIHTDSNAFVTPSGAKVGMTIAQVQGIYGSRGTLITGSLGNKGYSVRVAATALAVVFLLDETNTKVKALGAGEAQALEDAVRHGEGC